MSKMAELSKNVPSLRWNKCLPFFNISEEKMPIKGVIVLFTSAVRSEGGFINASLKEVSIAPVIFITSVQTRVRSLTPFHSSGLSFIQTRLKIVTSQWILLSPRRAWWSLFQTNRPGTPTKKGRKKLYFHPSSLLLRVRETVKAAKVWEKFK